MSSEPPQPPKYVENTPLILPGLDTPQKLGALWNCRTSEFLPNKNLFQDGASLGISPDHLVFFPKKELVYNLSHVRSTETKTLSAKIGMSAQIEINVLVGKIKVNIGKADYEARNAIETNEEELQVKYEQETYVVRVLPSANEIIPDTIKEQLENGSIDCTHVLTEVFLGAELLSTIKIKKVHTEEFEDKSASGIGNLVIGPISTVVKKALSVLGSMTGPADEYTADYNTETNFVPTPAESDPQTVEDVFRLVDKIPELITDVDDEFREFPQLPKEVIGWPIRYFLVPVQNFVNFEAKLVDPVFEVLQAQFIEDYTLMMSQLADFSREAYLRHYICQRDMRLKQMLSDQDNLLCMEVLSVETDYVTKTESLHGRCQTAFTEYQQGQEELKDLQALMVEYHSLVEGTKVDEKVDGWVERGRKWLSQIHVEDLIEDAATAILTSTSRLNEWIRYENPGGRGVAKEEASKPKVRLLLKTGRGAGESGDAVDGCLLRLYNLSKYMEPGSVAITLPEVTPNFALEVFLNGSDTPWKIFPREEADKLLCLLKIMATVTGHGEAVTSLLFQLIAATDFKLDIYKWMDDEVVDPDILQFLLDKCSNIHICETFISLREEINRNDQGAPSSRWKFVVTLEAFESAIESYEHLLKLKATAAADPLINDQIDWIVGSFNLSLENTNAPLLFIFKDGQLHGVCLDKLELGLLESNLIGFIKGSTDLSFFDGKSDRMVRNCFYKARAIYAVQVSKLFSPTLAEGSFSLVAAINNDGVQARAPVPVHNALLVLTAAASFSPQASFASALTALMLSSQVDEWATSHLQPIIIELGWSAVQSQFPAQNFQDIFWVTKFRNELWNLVAMTGGSELVKKLGICIRTLDACVKDIENSVELEMRHDPRPQIQMVLNDEDCDPGLKALINEILASSKEQIDQYREILTLLQGARLAQLGLDTKYTNIHFLIGLLELIVQQLEPETEEEQEARRNDRRKHARQRVKVSRQLKVKRRTTDFVGELLVHFLDADGIEWPAPELKAEVKNYIEKGLYSNALHSLSVLKFPIWHQNLFRAICLPLIVQILLDVVDVLCEPGDIYDPTEVESIHAYCWSNPQFQVLMHSGLSQPDVIQSLIDVFCKVEFLEASDEGMLVVYPPFLTSKTIAAINDYLKSRGDGDEGQKEEEWETLKDVLYSFQLFYRAHTHESIDTPASNLINPSFHAIFRSNMVRRPDLYDVLRRIGTPKLLNWAAGTETNNGGTDETMMVMEPVHIQNIREAIDLLMAFLENDGNISGDNFRAEFLSSSVRAQVTSARSPLDLILVSPYRSMVETIRNTKAILALQSYCTPITMRQFKAHWDNNESYQQVIRVFTEIIQLESKEQRNEVLGQLDREFIVWNTNLGRQRRKDIRRLHEKLKEAYETDNSSRTSELPLARIKMLIRALKSEYEDLNSMNLHLTHFFYEFQQLYNFFNAQARKIGSVRHKQASRPKEFDGAPNFPRALTDYFEGSSGGGGSIQLFENPCSTLLNGHFLEFLGKTSSMDDPIFVVTLIGMVGTGTCASEREKLLQHIYRIFSMSVGDGDSNTESKLLPVGGSGGITVHRIPIKNRLTAIRTVLLIETEECRAGLVEYNLDEVMKSRTTGATAIEQLRETKLISFLASLSHLIIVDWNSLGVTVTGNEDVTEEMLNIVGRTLVDCARIKSSTSATFKQDLVFVAYDSDHVRQQQSNLSKFVSELSTLLDADANWFTFGLPDTFQSKYEDLMTRIANERICIQPQRLVDELSLEEATLTSREWGNRVRDNWQQIQAMYPAHENILVDRPSIRLSSYETASADLNYVRDLWTAFNLLGVAFLRHADACEQYLIGRLNSHSGSNEEFEGIMDDVLQEIRDNLSTIPQECQGLLSGAEQEDGGGDLGVSCQRCANVRHQLEETDAGDAYPAQLQKQIQYLADGAWNKCYQMGLVSELQVFKGVTMTFDQFYQKALELYPEEAEPELPDRERLIIEYVSERLKFWYTDRVRVPLLESVIRSEVRLVYSATPLIVQEFEEFVKGSRSYDWPTNALSPFTINFKLKGMVDDVTVRSTRVTSSTVESKLHQPAMVQELQLSIAASIDEFRRIDPEIDLGLDPNADDVNMEIGGEFYWNIHAYCLKLFYTRLEELEAAEWRSQFGLELIYEQCRQTIQDEVRRRLSITGKNSRI